MCCQKKKKSNQTQNGPDFGFYLQNFNVDIINMLEELKKIVFKVLKESMVLTKECLQENSWKLKIYHMKVLKLKIPITEWKY